MDKPDLTALTDHVNQYLADELASTPNVVEKNSDDFTIDGLETDKREWHRVSDVVAVVSDLKSSTSLGLQKWMSSTAAIIEAASGGTVQILGDFGANYWQVQGDGVLAVFWGKQRVERALCSAITIQTYGAKFAAEVAAKWSDAPPTGIKIGAHSGTVLVKKVGAATEGSSVVGADPVWIGSPVNYAAKCAQQVEAGNLLVTNTLWKRISENDYIAYSCDCSGPSPSIWKTAHIDKVRESEQDGRYLVSKWCDVHGADFCAAILDGQRQRESVKAMLGERALAVLDLAQKQKRDAARHRRRGLT